MENSMIVISSEIVGKATTCVNALSRRNLKLITIESCTGGLLSAILTSVPGASDVLECGLVTYSNAAKSKLLGIDISYIDKHGAVSEQVAFMMAKGAYNLYDADIFIAITGIAGPGGGSDKKPVGLVHTFLYSKEICEIHAQHNFIGDRASIRLQTIGYILSELEQVATIVF